MVAFPAGYLDAASGLPLHPVAAEALQAALAEGWADPSRLTGPGRRSAVLLEAARETMAEELGVHPGELSFVASGAHAAHLAVLGSLLARRRAGPRVVHSAVEHSAVLRAVAWHVQAGGVATSVPVSGTGLVAAETFLHSAAQPDVAVAVLQAANHEVGTRQPVSAVAEGLRPAGVPLVVDAGQDLVYGSAPTGAGVFFGDARLWGGPAGVGILVIRRGARWRTPVPADQTEGGRSAGVPNVPAIVAAAAAFRASRDERSAEGTRLSALVDFLRTEIPRRVPDTEVLGDPIERLPQLLTFSCLYVEGESILTELDRRGFAVSSGSSCTSDALTPSHVLLAMGALTGGNVRVSLPPGIDEAQVRRFLDVLAEVVPAARSQLPGRAAPPTTPGRAQARVPATAGAEAADRGAEPIVIDSRGRRCPLPVLDLARAVAELPVGAAVTVIADDPAAGADIRAWCRMRRQELVSGRGLGGDAWAFQVRRVR